MSDDKTPSLGKLFLSEFADKNLVEYDECTAHYEALSSDDMIEEMEFLFNPPIWSISFDFTSQRYYAFLSAIINLAGRTRNLSDKQRSILINIAILIRNKIRLRISPEKLAGFNKAVNFTLDTIRMYGLYPTIADLIDKEIMNYDGDFPISAIGEIIERRPDHEYAMAPEHVPERLFNDGPDSFSVIQAFLRSNGDPVPLEQYAASLFRQSGAVGEDGSVDLNKLTGWKLRYAEPIALLPGLQDYLNGVEETSKKVEAAIAAKKRANDEFEASPGALFANHDPKTATELFFTLPDIMSAMAILIGQLNNNQPAIGGLKKAITDHMVALIQANDGKDDVKFLYFFAKNKAALELLFDASDIQKLNHVAADIARSRFIPWP